MPNARSKARFALCVENKDCDDLEKGKLYRIIPDALARRDAFLRVVDESGEGYLYPESHFVFSMSLSGLRRRRPEVSSN